MNMIKKENIPNLLTLARIVMIPVFILVLVFWNNMTGHIVAAAIFVRDLHGNPDAILPSRASQTI